MRRTRRIGAGAAALAVLLAALVAPSSCGGSEDGDDANLVRVNVLPLVSFGPLHIARAEGFYEDEGLRVEEVSFKRSAYGLAPLAQGELDVLAGSVAAGLFNAIERGARIRIVADKGHVGHGPACGSGLLVRKELAEQGYLEDPLRLRGMRLLTNRDNTAGYFVDRALARVGLSLQDMDRSYAPNSLRPEALAAGKTDVLSAQEPWMTRTLATGRAVVWMRDHEVVPGLQHAVITFGPTLLDERPEVGRRFLRAYLRGVRRYNEGRTERNLEILARATGLDPEDLRNSYWPEIREDGRIDVDGLLAFQAWTVDQDLVERALPIEEIHDPRFLDEIEGEAR